MNMPICPGQVEVIRPSAMNHTPHHYHNNNNNSTSSATSNTQDDDILVDVHAGFAYIACTSLHGHVYV